MFGSDEEQNMTIFQSSKLQLISRTYNTSSVFFKMFFDKNYRRERYDLIVNDINQYQNINEFRSMVGYHHHRFPLASIKNISFLKIRAPAEFREETLERNDNVLIERNYMKWFWKAL